MKEILAPSRILAKLPIHSKKRLLELLAKEVAREIPDSTSSDIFEAFISRERLGSTALGEGIAIPHCRVKECKSIMGFFFQLESGIDFDAMDGQPVDLFFSLVVPNEANEEHLKALSEIASIFNQPAIRSQLRNTQEEEELYKILINAQMALRANENTMTSTQIEKV